MAKKKHSVKRVVVLSDIQAPSHDARAITALQDFVYDFEPDELYCVGDEADSRNHLVGTKVEQANTLRLYNPV